MLNIDEYIIIKKDVRFGRATVKGTRIAVSDVLSWLADGQTTEQILLNFPQLTKMQIKACLKYAAGDNTKLSVQ